MELREFFRFHFLKVLLAFVALQLVIFAIIQNYNHRPVAQRDVVSVFEGRTVKITPLSNDMDKDDKDEIALGQVLRPGHGAVKQKGNLISYAPKIGFVGVDSFAYTITDGRKDSKQAYVVVTVTKNLAPVAKRDSASVYSGAGMVVDVLGNDSDPENDSLFIKEFTKPLYGQLHIEANKLIYTAGKSTLSDSFTYKCGDGMNVSATTSVKITIKDKNDPCFPWYSSDIGDVSKKGDFLNVNKNFVLKASGADIWNREDGFHFAYQYVQGDCEMFTKVESVEGSNEWLKAGLMIRESLAPGSKMALVCMTGKNGVNTNHRRETMQQAESGASFTDKKTPYWVKIARQGNVISYYASEDGIAWKTLGNIVIPMCENVYIGFAGTSHDNKEIVKAVFSHFNLRSKSGKF